ncbi:hypothetical protein KIMH_03160 [Bombiscardovia apis]|uniref:Uncharacterized protein n=1 Tax=Bombiscardovia apis TaxID=2932182 RepID=A0ABM8BBB0_9BIFI|nr:hypothetical protein [Bombiscardovia apis]BDR54205.1 hypothetical protein KIMH_03160 [Bombiscardovia apis]
MSYKDNLAALETDNSIEVSTAYNLAKQQLQQVQTANLEGPDRVLPDEFNTKLDQLNTDFSQQLPQKKSEIAAKVSSLKSKHLIFLLVKIALIILGILMLMNESLQVFGFVLFIAGIVCHFIFKNMDNSASEQLVAEWAGFFKHFIASIGQAETLHAPATGLYKEVDDLYLKSLDATARGFEMSHRQMKKNMEAQNEQSQRALAAQAEQTRQMQEGMEKMTRKMGRR